MGDVLTGAKSANGQAVRLRFVVAGIEAYGFRLSALDEGLTGRLYLDGPPNPNVLDGTVLFTE